MRPFEGRLEKLTSSPSIPTSLSPPNLTPNSPTVNISAILWIVSQSAFLPSFVRLELGLTNIRRECGTYGAEEEEEEEDCGGKRWGRPGNVKRWSWGASQ